MASSDASMAAPSFAQPVINAIQQQIAALLPSNLASSITSQFAGGAPMQPSTVGAMPAMTFSFPASGSGASASAGASMAQPVISAIQQQITALLPSDLASAITSQFAGASSTGQAMLPIPAAASAGMILPSSDLINTFLSLPQAM